VCKKLWNVVACAQVSACFVIQGMTFTKQEKDFFAGTFAVIAVVVAGIATGEMGWYRIYAVIAGDDKSTSLSYHVGLWQVCVSAHGDVVGEPGETLCVSDRQWWLGNRLANESWCVSNTSGMSIGTMNHRLNAVQAMSILHTLASFCTLVLVIGTVAKKTSWVGGAAGVVFQLVFALTAVALYYDSVNSCALGACEAAFGDINNSLGPGQRVPQYDCHVSFAPFLAFGSAVLGSIASAIVRTSSRGESRHGDAEYREVDEGTV